MCSQIVANRGVKFEEMNVNHTNESNTTLFIFARLKDKKNMRSTGGTKWRHIRHIPGVLKYATVAVHINRVGAVDQTRGHGVGGSG